MRNISYIDEITNMGKYIITKVKNTEETKRVRNYSTKYLKDPPLLNSRYLLKTCRTCTC